MWTPADVILLALFGAVAVWIVARVLRVVLYILTPLLSPHRVIHAGGPAPLLSSKPVPVPAAAEKPSEKAPDPTGNQGTTHHAPPAAPATPDITSLVGQRQLKVLRAIQRAYAAGFTPEDIDRLLNAHSRRTSPPVASQAQALMAKQIPAGAVADLLGGTRGDILAWLKEIANESTAVPTAQEAVEKGHEQEELPTPA